jgi:hypothetical protein
MENLDNLGPLNPLGGSSDSPLTVQLPPEALDNLTDFPQYARHLES